MATNTVKTISIKNQSGSGYDSKPIGAEGENIEIPLGSDDRVLENAVSGVSRKESLNKVLRDNLFKPDGTTITVDPDGTLHGANTYVLPAATTTTLGGVKADGTTITVDSDGTIHGSSTIDIDNSLSDVSENPVQNKVVTEKLNKAGYFEESTSVPTTPTPRDADILGGIYTASDIAAIENPVFDDSGADPEITSFDTFKSTFRSQLSLSNLFKKIKAGLGYVVDKSMVVSNLTSTDDTLALSASQGKLLKDEINTLNSNFNNLNQSLGETNQNLANKENKNMLGGQHINCTGNITTGSWDDYTTFGFYSGHNLANAPASDWVNVLCLPHNFSSSHPLQIAFTSNNVYTRYKGGANASWTAWTAMK